MGLRGETDHHDAALRRPRRPGLEPSGSNGRSNASWLKTSLRRTGNTRPAGFGYEPRAALASEPGNERADNAESMASHVALQRGFRCGVVPCPWLDIEGMEREERSGCG